MIEVNLTEYEMAAAAQTGALRQIRAIRDGYDQNYSKKTASNFWQRHIEGACGEIAVAKALGQYWGGSVSTFKKQGDIDGTGWEVRTRSRHNADLIVRPDDVADRVFILVTGTAPRYRVHGWIKASDAQSDEYKKFYVGVGDAFFVPQNKLNKLGDLKHEHKGS